MAGAATQGAGFWDFIKMLGGGGQVSPQAQQAQQLASAAGADLAQNANMQALAESAGVPSRAAAGNANVQGLVMDAQNPQAAEVAAQMAAPRSAMNMPVQQAAAAPQAASADSGWWDTVMRNVSGRDSQGNPLTGEALSEFQRNHALGAVLGQAGAALGGPDTWQGRLGEAAYAIGAGGLSAMNAEKRQMSTNDFMTNALGAMTGGQNQAAPNQTSANPGGPIKQPVGTYTSQTSGGTTGTPTNGANPINSSSANLDESLARIRRLNGSLFS